MTGLLAKNMFASVRGPVKSLLRGASSRGINCHFPREEAQVLEAVQKNFPGAETAAEIESRVAHVLEREGFTNDNTLFCQSCCPDEINREVPSQDIIAMLHHRWGEMFTLGGLAGIPFTGVTGWKAFSAHVPIGGNIVLLYGPHVGVDRDNSVGFVTRSGQVDPSHACGAAIAALSSVRQGQTHPTGCFDDQQAAIVEMLPNYQSYIDEADDEMAGLSYATFYMIQDYLKKIVSTDIGGGKIAFLGGIIVNITDPTIDRFLPLSFEVFDPKSDSATDFLPQVVPSKTHIHGGISKSLF
mmetsp:Transcript_9107/g.10406  ORF Transcript_9107/g.10406 Transcript_9107/m.10406 type:complete len:298 (+) Transcript_9107:106-999(+)|eukprot:CAMPEP_0184018752 /NCGR_PEP_ID=MMETSP0954-20121128/8334_1 /TAXON_ID=627963 /ORGANISM="Aplanochytrium sp, Strain PBS07" /LENGTH=297 /DNA_ID=CAMNT_0026300269 /DNA_START=78 /DNA_END=971 /DNA_ORIENTATION=-